MGKSKEQFSELIIDAESALLKAIQNSRETNVLRGHEDIVTTVTMDSNSNFIFSGSKDGTVRRWNLKNNSVEHQNSSSKSLMGWRRHRPPYLF